VRIPLDQNLSPKLIRKLADILPGLESVYDHDLTGSSDPYIFVKQSNSCSPATRRRAARSLRNYINATIGFGQLEDATSIPANSLMRMFGLNGNPSAKNLFGVLAHLQAQEGVNFELRPRRS
jgi:hypothetical protein